MRTINYVLFSVSLIFLGCGSISSMRGEWELVDTGYGIFPGYYNIPLKQSSIYFYDDSIKMASGIYYYIDNPDDENSLKSRYPFVLYGKKAKYVVKDDSIKFYYDPWKEWVSFNFTKKDRDNMLLLGKNNKKIQMIRKTDCRRNMLLSDSVEYVMARVENLERFLVNYSIRLYSNDSIIYKDDKNPDGVSYKLSKGYFNNMIEEMRCLDLKNLKDEYPAEESGESEITFKIKLKNGRLHESVIYGDNAPLELKEALVSLIYSYQKYAFRTVKPLRIDPN